MGTLTLVRHGQAKPFEKESDQLSTIGEQQARALGQYWLRQGVSFDEVYSGTLVRQRRTAEIVGMCFAEAGETWPQLQPLPELNEYDAEGITGKLIPALAQRDENFRGLLASYEQNRHTADRNRHFQKMFEVVVSAWSGSGLDIEGVESSATFRSRKAHSIESSRPKAAGAASLSSPPAASSAISCKPCWKRPPIRRCKSTGA
jgi:broad specificity phosphatase PhoE